MARQRQLPDADEAAKSIQFDMTPDVRKRLDALRGAVRNVGHHKPSDKVMLEALVWAAEQDGSKIELDVLAPYRLAHPEASQK
jgi:hypothetical protein